MPSALLVINKCYGGFTLSKAAILRYLEIKGIKVTVKTSDELESFDLTEEYILEDGSGFYAHNILRDDPILVQVVKELGKEASGRFSELKIIEIPDDVQYTIEEYDGIERVAENHRTWY